MAELPVKAGARLHAHLVEAYQPDFRIDRTGRATSVAASFISSPPSIAKGIWSDGS